MLSNKRHREYHRRGGPTNVTLLLDMSGSMDVRRDETIREVNRYLDDLKSDGLKYRLTVKTFNTYVNTLISNEDIQDVGRLEHAEYRPEGWTALLDAVGQTLAQVGRFDRQGFLIDYPNPRKTLFVVVTDGEENRSRDYGLHQVRDMISSMRSDDFQFVFLGDGPGAWRVGNSLGFNFSVATDYSHPRNTENIYRGLYAASNNFAKGAILTTSMLSTPTTTAKANEDLP